MTPNRSTSLFEDGAASVTDILKAVNERLQADGSGQEPFENGEAVAALREMDQANQVM